MFVARCKRDIFNRSRSVGPFDELISDCDENDRNPFVDPYVVELEVTLVEKADAGNI